MGVHERCGHGPVQGRLLALPRRARSALGVGRRGARDRRASAAHRAHRQPLPGPSLSHLDRKGSGLRRLRARLLRQRGGRPQADEPDPRGERGERVLPGRARRELLRPLPVHPGAWPQGLGGRAGSGLGQPRRQCARPRRRLYAAAVPQPLRCPLRPGSRLAQRRAHAYGHGGAPGRADLAAVQDGLRSLDRRDVLAVLLRHRHQDGILADAAARSLPLRHRARGAARRSARARANPHAPREQRHHERDARSRQPPPRHHDDRGVRQVDGGSATAARRPGASGAAR